MSDTNDTFDDPDDAPETNESSVVRQLRQQNRELQGQMDARNEAVEKAARLERELAFREAGIDPKEPKMSYFVKGYDGEISTDAIKQAATDAGFLTTTTAPDIPATEIAAHERMTAASVGSAPPAAPQSNEAMIGSLQELSEKGGKFGPTKEEMMAWAQQNGYPTTLD